MAPYKSIPTDRIKSQRSVDGRNEAGEMVRITLIETEKATYVSRLVNGVGVSTTQFTGDRRSQGEPTLLLMVAQEKLRDEELLPAEPQVEPEPVAEPEPAPTAEPEAPVAQAIRVRGPNRPDIETEVWAEGDLRVVMIEGREYRYDLRRGTDTIDSLPATRSWRTERQQLISKGQGMLAAVAA